jgi:hypothetical protein
MRPRSFVVHFGLSWQALQIEGFARYLLRRLW